MNTATLGDRASLNIPGRTLAPMAVDNDGEPIRFFYDLPGFVSQRFGLGADAIDYWTRRHSHQVASDARDPAWSDVLAHGNEPRGSALRMFLPVWDLWYAEDTTVDAVVREVLAHTVTEVHALAFTDRGHYLAQLLTRWFSDGHIDWVRFRIGHLLATYFSMMPDNATAVGVITDQGEKQPLLGWETPFGGFVDVVCVHGSGEPSVAAAIDRARQVGETRWPGQFAGVRLLPLADITQARLYAPDGSFEPVGDPR